MKPSESEHPGVFTFHDLSYILCNRMEIFGTEKKCFILEVFTLEVLLYAQH